MYRTHARQFFGCARVDREDVAMGNRRIDHPSIEHAGQVDVGGVLAPAHDLRRSVVAFRGLAYIGEFGIRGERRRLGERHFPLFLLEPILWNAPYKTFSALEDNRV